MCSGRHRSCMLPGACLYELVYRRTLWLEPGVFMINSPFPHSISEVGMPSYMTCPCILNMVNLLLFPSGMIIFPFPVEKGVESRVTVSIPVYSDSLTIFRNYPQYWCR